MALQVWERWKLRRSSRHLALLLQPLEPCFVGALLVWPNAERRRLVSVDRDQVQKRCYVPENKTSSIIASFCNFGIQKAFRDLGELLGSPQFPWRVRRLRRILVSSGCENACEVRIHRGGPVLGISIPVGNPGFARPRSGLARGRIRFAGGAFGMRQIHPAAIGGGVVAESGRELVGGRFGPRACPAVHAFVRFRLPIADASSLADGFRQPCPSHGAGWCSSVRAAQACRPMAGTGGFDGIRPGLAGPAFGRHAHARFHRPCLGESAAPVVDG